MRKAKKLSVFVLSLIMLFGLAGCNPSSTSNPTSNEISNNEEEDYILVTLGCYSYCTSAICEPENQEDKTDDKPEEVKPVITGPSCVLYVSGGTLGNNGWYKSNAVVKFKSKTTTTKGATITEWICKRFKWKNSYL